MIYKLNKDFITKEINSVNKFEENKTISIPFDPVNKYYQEYLKWLEEGNTPLPADEISE